MFFLVTTGRSSLAVADWTFTVVCAGWMQDSIVAGGGQAVYVADGACEKHRRRDTLH